MSSLQNLRQRLLRGREKAFRLPCDVELQRTVHELERRYTAAKDVPGKDLIRESLKRFHATQRLRDLQDGQRVCYGLELRIAPEQPLLIEDASGFGQLLDRQNGIGQWMQQPRRFRRCYLGLVYSYFAYDGRSTEKPQIGQKNWKMLREYLHEHRRDIVDTDLNPDWVQVAQENAAVFTDRPCDAYGKMILDRDHSAFERLSKELIQNQDSWFNWELLMAQVNYATSLPDARFRALLPDLLELVVANQLVRDRGLIALLDRYIDSGGEEHILLRDASVLCWGNPWLSSDALKWGGVKETTRNKVAEWLRKEFIEAFFQKLARDGVGSPRRVKFWMRYLKSMSDIRFGLGDTAYHSKDPDFVTLRQKMKGLTSRIKAPDSDNNAFIMLIGNLVAVEFGSHANAFYGYDKRKPLPFEHGSTLDLRVDAPNSLKNSNYTIKKNHHDGVMRWEDSFEEALRIEFGIEPDDVQNRPTHSSAKVAMSAASSAIGQRASHTADRGSSGRDSYRPEPPPLERAYALAQFLRHTPLKVEDNRDKNGNLWILGLDLKPHQIEQLQKLGFKHKPGKGWWLAQE